jgi:hypothetical protein
MMATMSKASNIQLGFWVLVFFASFAFVMCAWGWDLQPLSMCLATLAGFTVMLCSYKLGIDRCLPAR